MPDIREVLNALSDEDRVLWTQHRTEMRRSYLTAHNAVLGVHTWTDSDDIFLDYIDIKLALLFDKSGRMDTTKTIATTEDANKIEEALAKQSEATRMMTTNRWSTSVINGVK